MPSGPPGQVGVELEAVLHAEARELLSRPEAERVGNAQVARPENDIRNGLQAQRLEQIGVLLGHIEARHGPVIVKPELRHGVGGNRVGQVRVDPLKP